MYKRNLSIRIVSRVLIWLNALKSFLPGSLKDVANILVSALFDIFLTLVYTPSNPKLLWPGLFFVRPLNFLVFVRGGTEDFYYLIPGREGNVDWVISRLLRAGDVFVDVGANVGYYTLKAASKGVRVISVEPLPENIIILKLNLKLNNCLHRVEIIDKCAWSENREIVLRMPEGYYGLASAFHSFVHNPRFAKVKCIRLDDILGHIERIRLLKLDIEGAEYEALVGMKKTLRKVDFIVIEVSRSPGKVIELLRDYGFSVKKLGFTTYILAYKTLK